MIDWIKSLFRKQKMIILVGLPGSGKSTYAKLLEKKGYVVISQDTLGDRKKCIRATREALLNGKSVVIDRTNVSKKQRRFFLDIAEEFDILCECHILNSNPGICLERVKNRKGHPTMPLEMSDEEKSEIIQFFATDYETPTYLEGFYLVRYVS